MKIAAFILSFFSGKKKQIIRMLMADDLYSILWNIQEKDIRSYYKCGIEADKTIEMIQDRISDIDFSVYE